MSSTFKKIDLSILLKQSQFPRYAWLGRHDWLQLYPKEGREIGVKFALPSYDARIPYDEYTELRKRLVFLRDAKLHTEAIWTWTVTRLLASGPKLFRPTLEQCMAMAEVEIDIPTNEYRQAYPVVIYQYPDEFAEYMKEKLGVQRFPKMAVAHHSVEYKFIQVSSMFEDSGSITAMIPERPGESIEQILTRRADDHRDDNEPEFMLGETLQRIALNFSLMMTHFSVKHKPLNPDEWRKHQGMIRKPKTKATGEKLALADVQIIEFEQHVEMYEERVERTRSESEATGRHVKPHWRKGHWRMQAHGPQLTLRKRMFIKPLMVRKELFVGEYSDTTTVYEGKNNVGQTPPPPEATGEAGATAT